MKHLAKIQSTFLKLAISWDQRSYDYQRKYLEQHPESNLRITAKPKIKSPFATRHLVKNLFETYTLREKSLKQKYELQDRIYKKFTGEIDNDHYITVSITEPEKGKIKFVESVNDNSYKSRLQGVFSTKDEALKLLHKRYPNAAVFDEDNIESTDKERLNDLRLIKRLNDKIELLKQSLYTTVPGKLYNKRVDDIKKILDFVEDRVNTRRLNRDLGINDEHSRLLDEIDELTAGEAE